MNIVEGYPFIVQRKCACVYFTGRHFFPHGFAAGNTAYISITIGLLAQGQLINHIIELLLYTLLPC